MPIRTALCLALCLLASGIPAKAANDMSLDTLFRTLGPMTNDLARYDYLKQAMPRLAPADRPIAVQLLAGVEDELGLYRQAILDFPLVPRLPGNLPIPQAGDWRAASAVDVVARLAKDRRIVMVNEAHHDAHTRELTLALLPRLRALGFTHFAAEALGDRDPALAKRGYPDTASGSEYLHEPLYGEIIRSAIRLGFVIVPYDGDSTDTASRERQQARNLYQRVFARTPDARLFVHAGYAHIDKGKGRLGKVKPMAMQLQELTGLTALSVDQVNFRDVHSRNEFDPYHQLVAAFHPQLPTALVDRATGKPWSASPGTYDVSVLLPPSLALAAGGDEVHTAWLSFGMSGIAVEPPSSEPARPAWLRLGGQRHAHVVDGNMCAKTFPCVIEAHYPGEPDNATAADRYPFTKASAREPLYLFPGSYRLRAFDRNGKTLGENRIVVAEAGPAPGTSAVPDPEP